MELVSHTIEFSAFTSLFSCLPPDTLYPETCWKKSWPCQAEPIFCLPAPAFETRSVLPPLSCTTAPASQDSEARRWHVLFCHDLMLPVPGLFLLPSQLPCWQTQVSGSKVPKANSSFPLDHTCPCTSHPVFSPCPQLASFCFPIRPSTCLPACLLSYLPIRPHVEDQLCARHPVIGSIHIRSFVSTFST